MQPDRITVDEVMRRINGGEKLVFVDAREPARWADSEELIGGATRVPPDEVAHHAGRLPKNPLVIYADDEATSARVAADLTERGWREARPLAGGFEEWKRKRGFVTAKPKGEEGEMPSVEPVSRERHARAEDDRVHVPPPREGVTTTGRPNTPMADPPSAHRKQPDDVEGVTHTRGRGGDLDVRERVQIDEVGAKPIDPLAGAHGDRESHRFSQRPGNRESRA